MFRVVWFGLLCLLFGCVASIAFLDYYVACCVVFTGDGCLIALYMAD